MTTKEADQQLTGLEKAVKSGAMSVPGALARAFLLGTQFEKESRDEKDQ